MRSGIFWYGTYSPSREFAANTAKSLYLPFSGSGTGDGHLLYPWRLINYMLKEPELLSVLLLIQIEGQPVF
jgi:hypothetical protein